MTKIANIKAGIAHLLKGGGDRAKGTEPRSAKHKRMRRENRDVHFDDVEVKFISTGPRKESDDDRQHRDLQFRDTGAPRESPGRKSDIAESGDSASLGDSRQRDPLANHLRLFTEYLVEQDSITKTHWLIIDDVVGYELGRTMVRSSPDDDGEEVLDAARRAILSFSVDDLRKICEVTTELMPEVATAPVDAYGSGPNPDQADQRLLVLGCLLIACQRRLGTDIPNMPETVSEPMMAKAVIEPTASEAKGLQKQLEVIRHKFKQWK